MRLVTYQRTSFRQLLIRAFKPGEDAPIDKIPFQIVNSLSCFSIVWLSRVCRAVWTEGRASVNWQTEIVVSMFKKGNWSECSNYRATILLSFPGIVYARVLERKCRTIVEAQIQDAQCALRAGREIADQLLTLRQVFEKAWKFTKPIYTAFIDLDKAYNWIPRDLPWGVLKEYGINGRFLPFIRFLYDDCRRHVRINGRKSDSFRVRTLVFGRDVYCLHSCSLFLRTKSPVEAAYCVKRGNARVESLLFVDNVARLPSSTDGLQRALDRFTTECTLAGVHATTKKTEIMLLSKYKGKVYCEYQWNSIKSSGEI